MDRARRKAGQAAWRSVSTGMRGSAAAGARTKTTGRRSPVAPDVGFSFTPNQLVLHPATTNGQDDLGSPSWRQDTALQHLLRTSKHTRNFLFVPAILDLCAGARTASKPKMPLPAELSDLDVLLQQPEETPMVVQGPRVVPRRVRGPRGLTEVHVGNVSVLHCLVK